MYRNGSNGWDWYEEQYNNWGGADYVSPFKGRGSSGSSTNTGPRLNPTNKEHGLDTMTELFSKKFSDHITEEEDLFLISDDTLEVMAKDSPDDLILLTKELMFRAHKMHTALRTKGKADKKDEEKSDGKAA